MSGQAITTTPPTVGGSSGTWGALLNAWIAAIEVEVERKVNPADMTINATLDMNDNEVGETAAVQLTNKSAVLAGASNANKIYIKSGELYVSDGNAIQVQLTSAGALNAASIGGFTGDFGGSEPARAAYSAAASSFIYTQDPGVPAKADHGDILLRETAASALAVTIKSPASLAGAYTVTFPAAVPAGNYPVAMSSAGVLTVPSIAPHGSKIIQIPAGAGHTTSGTFSATTGAWSSLGTTPIVIPVPLEIGQRIRSVSTYVNETGTGVVMTTALYRYNATSDVTAAVGSQVSPGGGANRTVTIGSLTETVAAGVYYFVKVTPGESSQAVYMTEVTVDRGQ